MPHPDSVDVVSDGIASIGARKCWYEAGEDDRVDWHLVLFFDSFVITEDMKH